MSDPQTFDAMIDDLNEKYADFQDDFWGAVDKIVDMLNGAAGSIGEFFDDILPGGGTVDKAIDYWNDELLPSIESGMSEVQTKLSDAVNSLAGNPLELQGYAETFVDAKSSLYKQRSFGETAQGVSGAWAGAAFDKYTVVASEQNDALLSLANALQEGGTATTDAAHKILELWRKLIYEFASFGTDVINILASATDASKILSFEVPVILESIAYVWQKVVNIADLLLEFMTAQATTDSLNWRSLTTGADGLPGNIWPPISETASDSMNNPGNWNVN